MFKLTEENPRVWWPVTIGMPVDGGKTKKVKCKIQFELLGDDEYSKLCDSMTDPEVLATLVKDWEGVGDQDGKPIEATPENVKRFVNIAYVRRALFSSYMKAQVGAAEKN